VIATQIPAGKQEPTTVLTHTPPKVSTSTNARFKFGHGAFKCSLDGGAAKTCVSPKTYTHLSFAQHTFRLSVPGHSSSTYNWTVSETSPCNVTLNSGAELGSYANDSAYTGKTICLNDGDYTLTRPQHTAGLKFVALHPGKVRAWGWIEAYGAGEEWHGVSFNNSTAYTARAGSPSNPGFTGGISQGMQVYADDFVFVDGELTNGHTAGGWFLGRPGQPINNLLIARNKIHAIGTFPGGTGNHHPFYADNASGQITDNWLWDNVGFGIQFYPDASNLHFDRNVIDGQQEACAIFGSSGQGNTFKDNICVSTSQGVTTCCGNVGGSVGHNWFWNVSSPYDEGNYTRTGGDGSGDPGFVDYANHDYRLTKGAAATGYGPG
jgi:hypothetical protein